MNYYVLILLVTAPLAATATSAGPFDNLFACEMAAKQAVTLAPLRISSVCVNLKAKPHHWNGKPVK